MEHELHKLRIHADDKASRHERPIWPIVLVIFLIGAGVAGLWQWRSVASAKVVSTVRVRAVEEPGAANDRVMLNATGYIMAAHKIELASKVIGRVAWVGVEMGDRIEKGQVLVRLEDDEYKARVAQALGQLDNAKARLAELEAGTRPQEVLQAQAALDQAEAELLTAQISLKRLEELKNSTAVSQQQIDDAEGLVRSRQAQVAAQRQVVEMARLGPRKEQIAAQRATVRQLEGAVAMAELDLANTVIRSPIAATVLERNVEVGEFVTTGFVGDRGAKGYVVSIADLSDLRVELDISQNDFAKVSAKQPCWIVTDAYPDRRYEGVVHLISPEANRQKGTVQVRVKVLNPDDLLKPDMNATVSFLATATSAATQATGATGRPAIRVPAAAVRGGSVFVLEAGRVVQRPVTVGRSLSGGEIEIQQGLIGGEDLVISPPSDLKDGDRVKTSGN